MDIDPEDVRYNFIRWLNNDVGTAIGPSRVNPVTGEILDADIILTDGWIRHYKKQFNDVLPKIAMQGFSPQTMAWLAKHPKWDPRIRLAAPAQRDYVRTEIARTANQPLAGHALTKVDPGMIGDDEFDGLVGRVSQTNGRCSVTDGMAMDIAMMRMYFDLGTDAFAADSDDDAKHEKESPIVGNWEGVLSGLKEFGAPFDSMPLTMKLEIVDGELVGSVEVMGERTKLEELHFDESTGKFSAKASQESPQLEIELEAELVNGDLIGDWSISGDLKGTGEWKMECTDKRKKAANEDSSDEKSDGQDDKDEDDEDNEDAKSGKKPALAKKKSSEQMIDGMPESFIGPLVAHLVAHEVGHTLGLRHNFKGSSIYTVEQVNSDEVKGKKPLAGSVMDYMGVNMNVDGKKQGDWAMIGIGPYDMWAIEYGYTFSKDLQKILGRVAEPELAFATDEDTWGPDPLARRYDFGKDPLKYAEEQVALAKHHRERIIDKFVKDGDSWSKARLGYEQTLSLQMRAISMMANWLGGAHVYRDKKGDKNGRDPVEVVPVDKQRNALAFVIENSLRDEAFGLTPELLEKLSVDKWLDGNNFFSAYDDATWPVHDRIMGMQSSVLTLIMNPTTLELIYDNEYRVTAEEDMITLPEVLSDVTDSIWSELSNGRKGKFTNRKPMISSLRRNLQREHLERLIDLALPGSGYSVAYKPIGNLARLELRKIEKLIEKAQSSGGDRHDDYTTAHLAQAAEEIEKSLDADYIYNAEDIGGGGGFGGFFIFQPTESQKEPGEK